MEFTIPFFNRLRISCQEFYGDFWAFSENSDYTNKKYIENKIPHQITKNGYQRP
jgi:hypothetical protein